MNNPITVLLRKTEVQNLSTLLIISTSKIEIWFFNLFFICKFDVGMLCIQKFKKFICIRMLIQKTQNIIHILHNKR